MADCKLQFIKETEVALSYRLDKEAREIAVDTITTNLDRYDVTEKETHLIPYQEVNEELLKRYVACLLIEGKSKKTVMQYKYTVEKFAETVRKNYNETTVYDIRLFLAYEKQRGVSNRTLENIRANLSAFFQWLTREDLILKNPCLNVPCIKYTDKVRLPFSDVEIDKLRAACKTKKERAIIELLLSSGVRVSELTALNISDIDFNAMTVHVRCGKGAKDRTTYINDLTRTHLEAYLTERKEQGDILFYNKKKQRLNAGGVRFLLHELEKRAGVDNVHPHRFRRTLASKLASRGMNIQDIQHLLGHTNINTTMEYVHMSNNAVHASYLRYIA